MRLDREKLGEIIGGYDNSGGCVLSVNICSNKETCATCNEELREL